MGDVCSIAVCHSKKNKRENCHRSYSNHNELKHELNEYKSEYHKLKLENKELLNKLNNSNSKRPTHSVQATHHNWDYKEICEWIMKIENGIFKPYKQTLLKNLENEEISGRDLCYFDKSDLQRLGIINNREILIAHIHELTKLDTMYHFQYDHELEHNINTPTSFTVSRQKTISRDITINDKYFIDDEKKHSSTSKNKRYTIHRGPSLGFFSSTKNVQDMPMSPTLNQPPKLWKYKDGVLLIKVIKATCGDYVALQMDGYLEQKEMTKSVDKEERFQFFSDYPEKDILRLSVWNRKKWAFDEKIGNVDIAIIDVLNENGYIKKSYDIIGCAHKNELYLELKYKELNN